MRHKDFKNMLGQLGFILRCPVCHHKYPHSTFKIVDENMDEDYEEGMLVIHTDCGKCKSSVVFNIDIFGPEVSSAAMVTDLTSADARHFYDKNPINADDVLDFHEAFSSFKGDFAKLFA